MVFDKVIKKFSNRLFSLRVQFYQCLHLKNHWACRQVQVLDYKERAVGKDLVQVAVFVEHESQKGIVVGRGGSALKAMATAARADIEAFVGEPSL